MLVLAGVGAAAVPAVRAESHGAAEGRLDAAALAAARTAAAGAPTRDAAIDQFVAVYVRVSGDAGAQRALYDALRGDALRGVPPASPPVAVASAAGTTGPPAPPVLAGVLPASGAPARPAGLAVPAPPVRADAAVAPLRRAAAARAP